MYKRQALPLEQSESLAGGAPEIPIRPGVYRTEGGGLSRSFAVNIRPSESDLTLLPQDTFAALGIPLEDSIAHFGQPKMKMLQRNESEKQQGVWRLLIVALLAVLGAESWLVFRASKIDSEPSPSVSP